MLANPSIGILLFSTAVGLLVALVFYYIIVRDGAPWAEKLRSLCAPKYSRQTTPFQNIWLSFLFVTFIILVNSYFCIFMFLKHSIDDVFSGAFALAFLSPLVVLHNLRWDFSSRMAASRRAKSTFEDNPLNFKIYAIDAALTVATLLVYAGVFDLVLYLQVNRN